MDPKVPLSLRTEESCRHIASKCLDEIEFSVALDTFDIFLKLTVICCSHAFLFSFSLVIAEITVIYLYWLLYLATGLTVAKVIIDVILIIKKGTIRIARILREFFNQ